ncbi:MAG: transcription termination factor Rho [Eubacteriales bacterium]|nr:transcription termination factor Rho [Eubacteriales bacterium]
MREKYESLSLAVLRELAKARGLKGISTLRKPELVERMLLEDEKTKPEENLPGQAAEKVLSKTVDTQEKASENAPAAQLRENTRPAYERNPRDQHRYDYRQEDKREENRDADRPAMDTSQLDSGEKAHGILEVMPDGFGFIRCANYLPGENDIYVSPSQIRRFGLKTGDILQGNIRIKTQGEKFSALLYVSAVNGMPPSVASRRSNFEDMTPVFPYERLRMERPGGTTAMRIVDIVSPIGKGQRGMIVSPPKAGKTTLLKDAAKSILYNNPDMHLIILLIDERPEEVTDIKEAIQGKNVEVIYSTFDELPERHKRVSEMVIERAKRLVEHKKDVTILLDSITRLARAYNLVIPPSGRTLSGGLDPAALHMPKRFFGAARKMREGGSLTILATALVDTGSKMDDVIYEEFKGTGNMELVLDRKLQEKRVFPAIDIQKSGTRREDLLFTRDEQDAAYIMRKALNGMKADDAVEQILNMFAHTRNNDEFVNTVKKQKFL